jgi:tRNA G18 (ribose-2'-O)-methylase SpoU
LIVTPLTDLDDPRAAPYRALREAVLRRGDGDSAGGLFIAEGELLVPMLLHSTYRARSVLVSEARLTRLLALLGRDAGEAQHPPVYVAPQAVMDGIAGFSVHRGVLAAGERGPELPAADVVAGRRCIVISEDLNNADNLGSVFRSAAALGAGAVLLSPGCYDPLYRRSLRVSMGHALSVPFARVEPWPDGLGVVRAAGFRLIALTTSTAARPIDDLGESGYRDQPIAILVGGEGHGLSAAARAVADVELRIPMVPGVDSLNVGVAAAIALHRLACPQAR